MRYLLKHFDTKLVKFTISSDGIDGLSLFNYAMKDDLQDMDAYAKTRLMAASQDFLTFAKEVKDKEHNHKLKKLINFKFKKHARYNLSKSRLKIIERFIQKKALELLVISA